MRNIKYKYLAIVILPILIIISMSVTPITTNSVGKDITIKGKLFYNQGGENSYLEYDIESIPIEKGKGVSLEENDRGDIVYVVLSEDGGIYTPKYISKIKPKNEKNYLKGRINYLEFRNEKDYEKPTHVNIQYTLSKEIENSKVKAEKLDEAKKNINVKEGFTKIDVNIKINKGYGLLKGVK